MKHQDRKNFLNEKNPTSQACSGHSVNKQSYSWNRLGMTTAPWCFSGLLLKSRLLRTPTICTHQLIWPSSSCKANRRSEKLLAAVGVVEQEDTDFESALCPEIPAVAPACLCNEIHGLQCFIVCNTLCTFALTEWLELTDLKKEWSVAYRSN